MRIYAKVFMYSDLLRMAIFWKATQVWKFNNDTRIEVTVPIQDIEWQW